MRETINPDFEAFRPAPRVRFGGNEILQIAYSVIALGIAMAFVRVDGGGPGDRFVALLDDPIVLIAALSSVAVGFVGHELAHKIVAQRYGHFAEYRASLFGLGLGLLTAILARFLFAVPGAVHILGNVTNRENGIISIVGPAVNIVIALAALPFLFVPDTSQALPTIMGTVAFVNAFLAVFNLIPAGPIDGRKVWNWNKPVWAVSFGISLALFVWVAMRSVA